MLIKMVRIFIFCPYHKWKYLGYISRKDMATKIREMNILEESEIKPFLIYLDPTDKGFVDFTDFSAKVRVGMVNNDSTGRQTVIPFVTPSTEHHKEV